MVSTAWNRRLVASGLLLLGGCLYPAGYKIDETVCDLAMPPRDPLPAGAVDVLPPPTQPTPATLPNRLSIPPDLMPRGEVAPIQLPPLTPQNEEKRKTAIASLFPTLESLGEDPGSLPGPDGHPLTLGDLQKLALANSPAIKQAIAAVESAHGAAVQAGLYPNPTMGFQQDTANTTGGPGYVGGFADQKIIVTNKLQLARAAAAMDQRNAEVALRRAQTDLATRVRSGYFAVLVARENQKVSKALALFTGEVYRIQVDQVTKGGFAAPYEPMQLRALAFQARAALVQARNRYTGAWKQLVSTMGVPGMPPTDLAGSIDMPAPVLNYPDILARVLQCHTDLQAAGNTVLKARYNWQLARVTPVPDVDVRTVLQKDYTGPPFNIAYSVAVSVPVPVWDRNQGGIHQAEANLIQASEEANRVRADLTTRLADAFERYQNSRTLLGYYRDHILPDQIRVYRGVYERYQRDPGGPAGAPPSFAEVVVAQQNLAGSLGTYLLTLGQFWQSIVDASDLLQSNDLFQTGTVATPTECVTSGLDFEQLLAPPCRPSCAPQPGPASAMSSAWPRAVPEQTMHPARILEQVPKPVKIKEPVEDPADGQSSRLPMIPPTQLGFTRWEVIKPTLSQPDPRLTEPPPVIDKTRK